MTKKTKLLIALAAVLLAGAAAAGGWWLSRQTAPATAEAEPPKPAPDYKYVTLDKVIVMLRGRGGEAVSHYMAVDIVFKALPDQEKRAKEHLPLLRTVAVKALSSYTVESASGMTVEQFAAELNKAYTASYGAEHREPPFAEALIGKLIIE
ncbi:MAG TPA: flagellar basal body-associated FliL family protein [Roseateles sp.]